MRLQQIVDQTGDSKTIDPDIRRHEGDTVDFQVTVDEESVPFEASCRFVWTKNESEVRLGSRYGVHQSPRGSRLRIIDLSTVDTGRYTCHVAVSTAGRVQNGSCNGLVQDAVFNLSVDEHEMNDVVNLKDRIRNLHNRAEQREINRQARRSIKRPYQCRHPLHHHDSSCPTQRLCSTVQSEESRDPAIDNAPTTSDAFRFWAGGGARVKEKEERAQESSPPKLPSTSPPPRLPHHDSSFSSSPGTPAVRTKTLAARGDSPPAQARPSVIAVSATLSDVVTLEEVESPLVNVSTTLDEVVTSHDVAHRPTDNDVVSVSAVLTDAATSQDGKSPPISVSACLNGEGPSEDEGKPDETPASPIAASMSQDKETTPNDLHASPIAPFVSDKIEDADLPEVADKAGSEGVTPPAFVIALVDDVIEASARTVLDESRGDSVTSAAGNEGGVEVREEEAAVVNVDLSTRAVDDNSALERKLNAGDDGIAIRRSRGEGGMSEKSQSGVQFRHEQLPAEEIPFPDRVVELKVGVDPWQEYEKLEKIGSGGFSEVFRCRERATGLDLAAKVARYRASNKSSLMYEIDILRQLCHPRVMRLYDVFDYSRRIVLISEYVGGGELCERIIEDNFLSEEQACNFVVQILRGVSYLHKQSVIHLDLKPENIVCTTKSSYDIKIIDFGFAQRYEGDQKPIRFLGGTANFTAPEVINYEPLTFAADVWAVGVIAFLLLSGYAPFDGDSDQEVLVNVTKGNYDYDDEVFDEISTTAREFIDKILVKNPSKRPTSHELLRDEWLRARGRRSTLHLPSAVTHMRCYLNRAREKWKAATTAIMAMQKFRRTQA